MICERKCGTFERKMDSNHKIVVLMPETWIDQYCIFLGYADRADNRRATKVRISLSREPL